MTARSFHALALPTALDGSSIAALERELDAAERAECAGWLLRGSGEVFCNGLDVVGEPEGAAAAALHFGRVLARLHAAPVPTLAVVDGAAIGGGLGLAAACDWVLATERASFGTPELLFGLLPAAIWPVLLGRLTPQRARAWALSATSRAASEALRDGVVDELVPSAGLEKAVAARSRALLRLAPGAAGRLRAHAASVVGWAPAKAIARGAEETARSLGEPQVRAALRAFAEGRAPWES